MIKKFDERVQSERIEMKGGAGSALLREIVSKSEMYDKCRLFTTITLKENCGIGYHQHENESEIFVVISGQAIYNDNGNEQVVKVGDVMVCASGEGHSIRNEEKDDCSFVALIVLDDNK